MRRSWGRIGRTSSDSAERDPLGQGYFLRRTQLQDAAEIRKRNVRCLLFRRRLARDLFFTRRVLRQAAGIMPVWRA